MNDYGKTFDGILKEQGKTPLGQTVLAEQRIDLVVVTVDVDPPQEAFGPLFGFARRIGMSNNRPTAVHDGVEFEFSSLRQAETFAQHAMDMGYTEIKVEAFGGGKIVTVKDFDEPLSRLTRSMGDMMDEAIQEGYDTGYQKGDRVALKADVEWHGSRSGRIEKVMGAGPFGDPDETLYRVRMDDGREINADERFLVAESVQEAYSHSFSADFYGNPYDAKKTRKPTNVADALASMDDDEWDEMAQEVFGVPGDMLGIEDVMVKIMDTDTVGDLSSPVNVWIDEDGYFTVNVYDSYDESIQEAAQSLNLFKTPLDKAVEYSEGVLNGELYDLIPDFDANYVKAQAKGKYAKNIPRVQMPVIEPSDIKQFESDLATGNVDIFAPNALSRIKERFPDRFSDPEDAAEWITLGQQDGDPDDDKVRARITRIKADKLKPLQSEIWLTNMIPKIAKFGVPAQGNPVTEATLIVSKDMYIIDGHHRTGQAWLADPDLKMKCLFVPLTIDELLLVAKSYGAALGNEPKESIKPRGSRRYVTEAELARLRRAK